MTLLRRAARPMLASIFISGGMDTLRNPAPKVAAAEGIASAVANQIPGLSEHDTETLIRINGGVQLASGSLLAIGRFPRLSSLALAMSIVPTTLAGHRFWEHEDPTQRKQQQIHFMKNLGLLGGLLLASADTAGKPGLAWRTKHAAGHAGAAVGRSRRDARRAAKTARAKLPV